MSPNLECLLNHSLNGSNLRYIVVTIKRLMISLDNILLKAQDLRLKVNHHPNKSILKACLAECVIKDL